MIRLINQITSLKLTFRILLKNLEQENFFSATKFYLKSISRSVHKERTKLERELNILKSEIAQWKYKPADVIEIQG